MNIYKTLLCCSISLITLPTCYSGTPIFTISPVITGEPALYTGQQGTVIYQVTNNTNYNLANLSVTGFGSVTSLIANSGINFCGIPLNIDAHSSCLLKFNINGSVANPAITINPQICFNDTHPIYCSQPLPIDIKVYNVSATVLPQDCASNVANFTSELSNPLETSTVVPGWGPETPVYPLSSANPDLSNCSVSEGIGWQQQRLLAAADFWIKQKINYCHHYAPDWFTPFDFRNATQESAGYCNPSVDIMPGSVYYNQAVRWNYNGQGSETLQNWQNNNYMWRGMDCSNYSAFLYNFAFGRRYTGDVAFQGGQRGDNSQELLSPNQQSGGNVLDNADAPGKLVCADNTLEVSHSCSGHGNYISVIKSDGTRDTTLITDSILTALHPGDLVYVAASLSDGTPTSQITHVFMWTGKKIGTGVNDIPASRIAPNQLCPNNWQPQIGGWVITDSHYHGADYRMLTNCFYQNNIWGVRREINP